MEGTHSILNLITRIPMLVTGSYPNHTQRLYSLRGELTKEIYSIKNTSFLWFLMIYYPLPPTLIKVHYDTLN